ncbi:MAG TPA: peptidoglycan editing factor PgeF [Thermoflexia bacterium]|nr:peptidoglycan editing factor PgeF [Thermoflexia bacterium]
MRRQERNGLAWYSFESPGHSLCTALLTRQGGVSQGALTSLNLGSTVGDDPAAVAENHRRVCRTFGIARDQIVSPHQVHGCHVAPVGHAEGGTIIPATDALLTNEPGIALLLRFADCTPVLFYDPVHHAAALAHAGWRGAAAGIVTETIRALEEAFGSRPEELWAGVGPAIGPEHYAVGGEVIAAIQATLPGEVKIIEQRAGQHYLDLPGAVAAQLQAAGVGMIEQSGLYTAGHTDEWYSHRAEKGNTGRFGVLVMLIANG